VSAPGEVLRQRTLEGSVSGIGAVVIANALEWYEIVIYGYLAGVIAVIFFPSDNASASLLLALASFGVTYITRPLGAVILGGYADRCGRKPALLVSIWLMVAGTAAIAFTPAYATIGIAAPIIVVLARFLQGFSAGGEFGSSTAFLSEQDPERRGYFASWQFASQGLTAILATGVGTLLTASLTTQQIHDWGWRIPFLLGLLIYPVAIYIRSQLSETPDFSAQRTDSVPIYKTMIENWRQFLVTIGLIILGTVAVYTVVFLPTYAVRQLSLSAPYGFTAGLLTASLQFLLVPVFGSLSDRHGRTLFPIVAGLVLLVGIYPAFVWLSIEPAFSKLMLLQGLLGITTAAYMGPLPALMSELFPVRARTSGLSICYAVGVAVFGGFAPFIHAWLIARTGSPAAPSFYVIFAAVISLFALFSVRHMQVPRQ
jgi:MHS family proline/betaine transporter-like MFS transporter